MDKKVIVESNIEELAHMQMSREVYERPGVWALYGLNYNDEWVCLEVAQTANVYSEIQSAIYILTTQDDDECEKCDEKYLARQRFKEYSAEFYVHKCKTCQHTSDLRIKSWKKNPRYIDKYQNMLKQNYKNIKFVCVNMSENMRDSKERKTVEKRYAEENRALYWWN